MSPADTMVRLALRLIERGDAEGAAEALRGVLAMLATRAELPPTTPQLATQKRLAVILGCSERHIRDLEARDAFGEGAVIGEGRGKRYDVNAVLAALGRRVVTADPIADEARQDMQRRAHLRALTGGAS